MIYGLSRRDLMFSAIAGVADRCLPAGAEEDGRRGLGDIAAGRGILYGSLVRGTSLRDDRAYADMVARECRLVLSLLEMRWSAVAPQPGVTDLAAADAVCSWATAHDMRIHGHPLVWHEQLPNWFTDIRGRAAAVGALERHVRTMCRHFAGRIGAWYVVNEAISTSSGRSDNLRQTPLIEQIGPDFLDIAFRAARESDGGAMLVYNEAGLELDLPWHGDRRAAVLALVDGFRKRGTPIDAVGIQSHLRTDQMANFDPRLFHDFLHELEARGLAILITELDVLDQYAPADIASRDAEVAAAYRRYLATALDNRAMRTVITWGLTDRDSWLTEWPQFKRPDNLPGRPLPFDTEYAPTPAYAAIASALGAAPCR
ncbi:MAG TPA: endo-1,4-beta-xylanase [Stellaceae bacterium]|nr:endo-1,4-beta-xylanase [Stellaceae bacterium]